LLNRSVSVENTVPAPQPVAQYTFNISGKYTPEEKSPTHQTGPGIEQAKVLASQVKMSPGAVSQVPESRTETPLEVPERVLQFRQLPLPVVLLPELLWPVRTQPCQKDGGPKPLSVLVCAAGWL
jgi:hypothetical protein